MGIGDGQFKVAFGAVSGNGVFVEINGSFNHRIYMEIALRLLNQVVGLAVPGVGPAVVCVQNNGVADVTHGFIGHNLNQLNGNRATTLAVLIIVVVPNLGDRDIGTGQDTGNTGNGEGILLAVHIQVGGFVGGEGLAFHEVLALNIQGNAVSMGVGVGGHISVGGSGGTGQLPGVFLAIGGSEVGAVGNHGDHVSHGVGGSPACTVQTAGDGLRDGLESGIQLSSIIGVVSTAGRGNGTGQELRNGNRAIGVVANSTEADSVQLGAAVLDGGCLVGCSSAVLFIAPAATGAAGSSGCAVRQQNNALGRSGDGVQQTQGAAQTSLHVGADAGAQVVDGRKSSIIAVLACAACNIAPVQDSGCAAVEADNGQLTACGVIGAGVGTQEILCGSLRSFNTAGCAGNAVLHGAGGVDYQNHCAAHGMGGGSSAGLNLQGDIEGVNHSLNGSSRLGKGNLGSVNGMFDGAGTAFAPLAVGVGAVDSGVGGGFSGRCGSGNCRQNETCCQQNAENFVKHLFHFAYLLVKWVLLKFYTIYYTHINGFCK